MQDRQRAMQILLDVLDVAAPRRAAVLDELCGGDAELRREVESLLAFEEDAEDFLREPAVAFDDPELANGTRLGPYRILGLVERGGMGAVYRAERVDDFEKRVALKVLRRDVLREETLRRFHAERQVLARLDHEGIAGLLDGGTTPDGRPYLVLDYVDGVAITRYCEEHALPVRQRLEPFLHVLAAVAYAHRTLVVHRDLKPDNVLIRTDGPPGKPVVVDFGIAKLLDPAQSALTLPQERPMTPCYASPEQIAREPVNTASDVYSLGVLLYELLTGRLPCVFGGCAFKQVFPGACADRGADAVPVLERDLEAIVRKALSREPGERYGSAEQFADDLRRYLDGRPVRARGGGWLYRMGRFLRRQRRPVAAVILLLAFTGTSTVLWRRAEMDRETAKQAELRSRLVSDFLKELFRSAEPDRSRGRPSSAREILDRGRARLDTELADRPEVQAEIAVTLANAYRNLGFHDEAEDLHIYALSTDDGNLAVDAPETVPPGLGAAPEELPEGARVLRAHE